MKCILHGCARPAEKSKLCSAHYSWIHQAHAGEGPSSFGTSEAAIIKSEVQLNPNLPDPDWESPFEEIDRTAMLADIKKHLRSMCNEREYAILSFRYGLGGDHPKTMSEVSKHFGITLARANYTESKAFNKIRHPLREIIRKRFQ